MSGRGDVFIPIDPPIGFHLRNDPQQSGISNADFLETIRTAFSSQADPVNESQPDHDQDADCQARAQDTLDSWINDERIDCHICTRGISRDPSEAAIALSGLLSALRSLNDLAAQSEGQTEGQTEGPAPGSEDHQGRRTTQGGPGRCSVM